MAEYTIDKIEYNSDIYNLQDNATPVLDLVAGTNINLIPNTTENTVTINATDTTYSVARYDALGLVKPAYSTTGIATLDTTSQKYTNNPAIQARTTSSSRYYAIEIDKHGCLFTNIPWTDTKVTTAALTSGTLYYPILAAGTSTGTRQIDSTLKGLTYKSTAGTTSAVGTAQLTLGNSTASGTTNNEQAQLVMYGTNDKKATITLAAPSADIALALPTSGGTLALTSQIPTVSYPVTSVNSKTGAVSLTAADVGALASGTTYVSKITTTAGAHTAISNKSGAVSFNVPTKTSHLTNDSDFITTSAFKAMFASGHVAYSSIATNSYADKTVSFGKTFSSAPNVTACLSTSGTAGNIGNVSVSVFDITTTQCTVRVFNNRGSALSPAIEWIAVNV